jgi:hypothetical protein
MLGKSRSFREKLDDFGQQLYAEIRLNRHVAQITYVENIDELHRVAESEGYHDHSPISQKLAIGS